MAQHPSLSRGESGDFALGTLAIHGGQSPDPSTGAVMPPIYATSTYAQSSPGVHQGFEYSRTHNPTRFAYERCVAALEGGSRGFAFASGMAATSTVLELLDSGSHVIAMDDLYGGSYRLFERVRKRTAALDFSFVDLTDLAAFEAAIRPETRMVWVETPTNPMLKIVDIAAVCAIARKHGLRVVVDNTFASPILQRPLHLGADIVMHSATKYLNGHSDMVGGMAVVGDDTELAEQMAFLQNSIGAVQGLEATLNPFLFCPEWRRIGHLPVVDDGRFVGMISQTDLTRVQARRLARALAAPDARGE